MKLKTLMGVSSALCLSAIIAQAQETNLSVQLQQMQERFEKQNRELRENFERTLATQQVQIDALKKQVAAVPANPPATSTNIADEMPPMPARTGWTPAQPITVARAGSSYMNMSFDTLIVAGGSSQRDPSQFINLGDHDPSKNGFSLRNAEI